MQETERVLGVVISDCSALSRETDGEAEGGSPERITGRDAVPCEPAGGSEAIKTQPGIWLIQPERNLKEIRLVSIFSQWLNYEPG